MAVNYEEIRCKFTEAFSNSPDKVLHTNELMEMLREGKPLNEVNAFINQRAENSEKESLNKLANEYWIAIQKDRSKNKMEKDYVNLQLVYKIVSAAVGETKATEIVDQLLPHTTHLKAVHSKKVETLIKVLKQMNFCEVYRIPEDEEDVAIYIDKKGIRIALPQLLHAQFDEKIITTIESKICKQMKLDLLPESTKKIRADPLANIISKLDFYHNYDIQLPTDEIVKEMHERGVMKVLRQLLQDQFGKKEVDRIAAEIDKALALNGSSIDSVHKAAKARGTSQDKRFGGIQ